MTSYARRTTTMRLSAENLISLWDHVINWYDVVRPSPNIEERSCDVFNYSFQVIKGKMSYVVIRRLAALWPYHTGIILTPYVVCTIWPVRAPYLMWLWHIFLPETPYSSQISYDFPPLHGDRCNCDPGIADANLSFRYSCNLIKYGFKHAREMRQFISCNRLSVVYTSC